MVDTPKPNSASTHDFEFFLGKIATVFLTTTGEFKILEGASAEFPEPPKNLDNAMKLTTIFYHLLHLNQLRLEFKEKKHKDLP